MSKTVISWLSGKWATPGYLGFSQLPFNILHGSPSITFSCVPYSLTQKARVYEIHCRGNSGLLSCLFWAVIRGCPLRVGHTVCPALSGSRALLFESWGLLFCSFPSPPCWQAAPPFSVLYPSLSVSRASWHAHRQYTKLAYVFQEVAR